MSNNLQLFFNRFTDICEINKACRIGSQIVYFFIINNYLPGEVDSDYQISSSLQGCVTTRSKSIITKIYRFNALINYNYRWSISLSCFQISVSLCQVVGHLSIQQVALLSGTALVAMYFIVAEKKTANK